MEFSDFMGTGKYILGVFSIISAFFSPIQGILFGLFGLMIERENNSYTKKGKKLNIIGIVLSIIVWGVTWLVYGTILKGLVPA